MKQGRPTSDTEKSVKIYKSWLAEREKDPHFSLNDMVRKFANKFKIFSNEGFRYHINKGRTIVEGA